MDPIGVNPEMIPPLEELTAESIWADVREDVQAIFAKKNSYIEGRPFRGTRAGKDLKRRQSWYWELSVQREVERRQQRSERSASRGHSQPRWGSSWHWEERAEARSSSQWDSSRSSQWDSSRTSQWDSRWRDWSERS